MGIEQFLRGCFDCGYESSVFLYPDGRWHIGVYEHSDLYNARFKSGGGATFDEAMEAFGIAEWRASTADATLNLSAAMHKSKYW